MYKELTVGEEAYKLKLTTKTSVLMEKALGYNPIVMLMKFDQGEFPKLNDLLIVLQYSLQTYHHGMSLDATYALYDRYVAAGHNMFDLVPIFVEVFQDAGYLGKPEEVVEEEVKN